MYPEGCLGAAEGIKEKRDVSVLGEYVYSRSCSPYSQCQSHIFSHTVIN